MRPTIDKTFIEVAYIISKRSTCKRRQVGCVLTDFKNRVIATGHNGVAMGQPHCINSPCPGATSVSGEALDLCEAIHAEQNALLYCSDPFKILTCYVTTFPCVHCIKMLMNTSCELIVYDELYTHQQAHTLWNSSGRKITRI